MEERPKVGIGVLIMHNGKALLIKRKSILGTGTWCFPGGKLEFGESFEECAKREIKEEVNLNIDKLEFISLANDIAYGNHYITIGLKASEVKGEPSIGEPEKAEDIGWFDLDKLPEPLFIPTKNMADNYLKKKFYTENSVKD